ncbi:MAG: hypothetical protein ACAI25_00825 [Planctomycetota bacterium]
MIYDRLLHTCAVEHFGMPREIPAGKKAIRGWFWSQPDGNTPWTELQGIMYGTRIGEAEVAPGLEELLLACAERGVRVGIVSHKTEFPALGPRVSLREAARSFLEARGFFSRLGVKPRDVFFESTLQAKVERVHAEGHGAFVDDLPDVFLHASFPAGVTRILYDPAGVHEALPGVHPGRGFSAIRDLLLGPTP